MKAGYGLATRRISTAEFSGGVLLAWIEKAGDGAEVEQLTPIVTFVRLGDHRIGSPAFDRLAPSGD